MKKTGKLLKHDVVMVASRLGLTLDNPTQELNEADKELKESGYYGFCKEKDGSMFCINGKIDNSVKKYNVIRFNTDLSIITLETSDESLEDWYGYTDKGDYQFAMYNFGNYLVASESLSFEDLIEVVITMLTDEERILRKQYEDSVFSSMIAAVK